MTRSRPPAPPAPPGPSGEPLIDVHAHFLWEGCGRTDWRAINAARLRAGARMGTTCHVGSILGSFGHTSPMYMPSPRDVTAGNDAMYALARAHGPLVRAYVMVNPNDPDAAMAEITRGLAAGAIGVKLAASRRADDPLVDPIAEAAAEHRLPVLQHMWQHRRRDWPNQEISDGVDLARLAARHPRTMFILAHIGGGGDWAHTPPAVRDVPNIVVDISGSGVDRGMLDAVVAAVGHERVVFGTDLTMETGLAKLRALEVMGLSGEQMSAVRWRNAQRIFPRASFAVGGPAAAAAGDHRLAASPR